jgi:hypothetical protein
MERFLRTHQKGSLHTPDPRESLLGSAAEVYRLLYGSQILGYLELYASTGKEPYLREARERLEALVAVGSVWSNSTFDGDLGFAFLLAYEYTGEPQFYEIGMAAARRMLGYCDGSLTYGVCELNWGMSAALCFAQAYRVSGEIDFLNTARFILTRTQVYQHADGSFPHQADIRARNLEYSSWLAFQLWRYVMLDPDVTGSSLSIEYYGRRVTLDVDLTLSRLALLLERQTAEDGHANYSGNITGLGLAQCSYCSSPFFPMCREHCGRLCDPQDAPDYPCQCFHDPLYDCPSTRGSSGAAGLGGPDPICVYCSNVLYKDCATICRGICERDSVEFPCYCVSDPELQCPADTILVSVNYFDEWDPKYETRGWTSELASTAFALAKANVHETKWRVLDFLFAVQDKEGSFPDKWGHRTEEPGTEHWLWASEEHSVIRTSIIFRVLASLLATSPHRAVVGLPVSSRDAEISYAPTSYSPRMLSLTSVFPNPTVSGMTVRFALPPGVGEVELVLVDIAGRTVKRLAQPRSDASGSSVTWDGTDDGGGRVAPGVYFAQVIGNGWRSAKKLVVLAR